MDEYGEITPKEAETITGKSAVTVRRYFKIFPPQKTVKVVEQMDSEKGIRNPIDIFYKKYKDIFYLGSGKTDMLSWTI